MEQRQQALANASQLSTQFLDLRERAFGRAAAVGEAGLAEQQQARGELADFLSNMQQLRADNPIDERAAAAVRHFVCMIYRSVFAMMALRVQRGRLIILTTEDFPAT